MRTRPIHPVIRSWHGIHAWFSIPRPGLSRALRATGLIAAAASFLFGSVPMPLLVLAVGMGLAAGGLAAIPVAGARVVAIGLYVLVSGLFESAYIMFPAVSWFPGQPALIVLAAVSLGHFFVTAGSRRYITPWVASPQLRSVLEALMHDEDSSSFPSIRRRERLPRRRIGVGL